jgi:hypothetical protein
MGVDTACDEVMYRSAWMIPEKIQRLFYNQFDHPVVVHQGTFCGMTGDLYIQTIGSPLLFTAFY